MSIKIEPCSNNIGAKIACDLKTAGKEEIGEIEKALEKFGVVFFRNQNLDSKSYKWCLRPDSNWHSLNGQGS